MVGGEEGRGSLKAKAEYGRGRGISESSREGKEKNESSVSCLKKSQKRCPAQWACSVNALKTG